MIVRILGERQYELSVDDRDRLDRFDDAVVEAVEAGDEHEFEERFKLLLEHVRKAGNPLADDALVSSDVILPPADTTLAEAAAEFTGDGLIPD